MFLITRDRVQEQDGRAEYYLLSDDIEVFALDNKARGMLLDVLGEEAILVESAEKSTCNLSLVDILDAGSSFHSKL